MPIWKKVHGKLQVQNRNTRLKFSTIIKDGDRTRHVTRVNWGSQIRGDIKTYNDAFGINLKKRLSNIATRKGRAIILDVGCAEARGIIELSEMKGVEAFGISLDNHETWNDPKNATLIQSPPEDFEKYVDMIKHNGGVDIIITHISLFYSYYPPKKFHEYEKFNKYTELYYNALAEDGIMFTSVMFDNTQKYLENKYPEAKIGKCKNKWYIKKTARKSA